ncbi:hypothetical protein TTHERM_00543610 (macronuclear) [Tetrahymena thermophila SB210]|uniref:Uncharacterized protein n=1 Tax=Tetrahymena thermophila (strain SB210) TaxID=312017 RepID=I7MH33_TETTS|nr:hypothetical protein TTHERM_00543610 [Tetrahymena thermophila SB210]EAR86021.4 hypothetical protein TTHERM_00543610 [Tetrahymena thermophila SB210]|eukprot:XP_976616.4 hypothetical protein TTHERM_00543610 [Tetrahymena thermophila SB210]
MRKIKVSPTNNSNTNSIKNAEDALRQKYSQYNNNQILQNKMLKATSSSGNSVQSEMESFQKQASLSPKKPVNGNNLLQVPTTDEHNLTPISQHATQEQKKFFQKKGKNDTKGKRGSFRISQQIQNDDDVQLNVKFQEEPRKLQSILLKEGAAYNVEANETNQRVDKFGNPIDHQKKKQKISFNEDLTVYEVENWKKYNNNMYDENDDKCHCNLIQMLFFFHLLSM